MSLSHSKQCADCGEALLRNFYPTHDRGRPTESLRVRCIPCHRARSYASHRRNDARVLSDWRRGERSRGVTSIPPMRELRIALWPPAATCYLCGRELGSDRVIDHVLPLSRGGSSDVSNLRWAHKLCNILKGPLTPGEFVVLAAQIIAHLVAGPRTVAPRLWATRADV